MNIYLFIDSRARDSCVSEWRQNAQKREGQCLIYILMLKSSLELNWIWRTIEASNGRFFNQITSTLLLQGSDKLYCKAISKEREVRLQSASWSFDLT